MTTYYEGGGVTVLHGDCIEMMRTLPDASVHAVVTDPPYGIAFMGKAWDQPGEFGSSRKAGTAGVHRRGRERTDEQIGDTGAMEAGRYDLSPAALVNFQRWCEAWAREAMRVLKPGGHLLAFGGSRTWHRLAAGIEDAGFEMRDSIAWLYGSGFPKSHPSVGQLPGWEGWGTALKPSFEPIVVARKPLVGTVAANVLAHGTGALNIDATRTATSDSLGGGAQSGGGLATKSEGWDRPWMTDADSVAAHAERVNKNVARAESLGRWPSNVILDESQAASLDEQSGTLTSGMMRAGQARQGKAAGILGEFAPDEVAHDTYGDSGGASRFFPTFRYEAKAPSSERPSVDGVQHPTVKPLDLMRWLVRLVTPPGGTVLEPFAGSGTTVEACLREGFSCIAVEREADYLPLIRSRIEKDHQQSLFGDWEGGAS